MSQFARPASDISTGAWAAIPSSPATLWDKVSEVVSDDAATTARTFIVGAGTDTFEEKLSTVGDPSTSAGHIVRVHAFADDSLGDGANIDVFLMQGAVQIATFTFSAGAAWVTGQRTLSALEADSISDYSDLRIRVRANGSVGNSWIFDVSQMELQVPSVVVPPFYDVFLWTRPDE